MPARHAAKLGSVDVLVHDVVLQPICSAMARAAARISLSVMKSGGPGSSSAARKLLGHLQQLNDADVDASNPYLFFTQGIVLGVQSNLSSPMMMTVKNIVVARHNNAFVFRVALFHLGRNLSDLRAVQFVLRCAQMIV